MANKTPKATEAPETEPKVESKPKGGKKKMIIIAAAIVILIGGGATAFFLLSGNGNLAIVELPPPPPPGPMTTHTFPKITTDLKTGLCKANYLSMRFMVEVGTNFTKSLQKKEAKLMEGVRLHLRSFERKDLAGKVGSDRLRADIITIINGMIKPEKIEGVIFKEFILQ